MQNNVLNKPDTSELNGLVWIKNGRVFVKNEKKGGIPPAINPCEGIKLYINGEECNHLITVNENDTIELKSIDTEVELQMEVEITEDKLKCYLIFSPAALAGHVISDAEPDNMLNIQATQVILETRKTDCQQILDYLKRANIVYGIRMDNLVKICENNKPGKYLIAEGLPPEESTDDKIEYFFINSNVKEYTFNENSTGKIDFKNILEYEAVSAGQTIAQLHKGKLGKNGICVTGEFIIPKQPKELTIKPSLFINYDPKTGTVRAAKTGRPFKQQKGNTIVFHIYDCIVLDEVSMRTGNIRFRGDIEVKTNVSESLELIARQNILIRGNVNFASIYAGNNITIKGTAVSSKINAVLNDVVAKDPAPLIEKLTQGINKLISNVNQLPVSKMSEEQIKYALRTLLNTQNKDLPALTYDVVHSLQKGNYDIEEDLMLLLIKKSRPLIGDFSEITGIEFLYQLISDLKSLFSWENDMAIRGDIKLNSVANCDITALGNVTVLGKGCVNSQINCKGKVIVTGRVRGGQIRSEKGIEIGIAGSERGSKILLAVPIDGYIQIRTVYPDTTIKVGGLIHTFYSNMTMVRTHVENDKLLF